MSAASLPPVVDDRFSMETGADEHRALVRMTGDADIAAQAVVGPYLRRLHTELRQSRARLVSVDLRELQFINSSCIKAFVTWIAEIVKLACDEQYRVVFHSNPAFRWQQRTLKTLQAFAPTIVDIEVGLDAGATAPPLSGGAAAHSSIAP